MGADANIVLCGFMGCGKSTVGRLLAKSTGRRFVDMDDYIEQREGRSITEIFRKQGEPAFRAMEREACRALAGESGLVVATGGGALIDPQNSAAFSQTGIIVLLDAPLSVLGERLAGDKRRPLLQTEDREKAMEALYCSRLPHYRSAARFSVDASRPPEAVCREILEKLRITNL